MTLADRYALICQEIKSLEAVREQLKTEILAQNTESVSGEQCDVVISIRETVTLDPKAVYDMVKPSRFFQMVSVKATEARKALSEDEFEAATKKVTHVPALLVKPKVAAIIG